MRQEPRVAISYNYLAVEPDETNDESKLQCTCTRPMMGSFKYLLAVGAKLYESRILEEPRSLWIYISVIREWVEQCWGLYCAKLETDMRMRRSIPIFQLLTSGFCSQASLFSPQECKHFSCKSPDLPCHSFPLKNPTFIFPCHNPIGFLYLGSKGQNVEEYRILNSARAPSSISARFANSACPGGELRLQASMNRCCKNFSMNSSLITFIPK